MNSVFLFKILFVFTFGITLLNMIKILSVLVGNKISYPRRDEYFEITIIPKLDIWWLFYPCFFYQLWIWCQIFNLI